MMTPIRCNNCGRPYPEQGVPYRCVVCGSIYDADAIQYAPPGGGKGIWRYRKTFSLPESAPEVSLGEGNTPLIWAEAFGRPVAFKLEFLNPSGSYKDRGSAVLSSFLLSRGVEHVLEDSSGNAGASLAAYASRAGMNASIYVPEYAGGPKRRQIEAYGAQVISVPGERSKTSEAVLEAVAAAADDPKTAYASHAYLPFGLFGYATIAYEIYEQLGKAPRAVISPVGQGNLLLAVARGFSALKTAGIVENTPKLIGVQARACAPLWAVFEYGPAGLGWVTEGETLAEGVRIKHPLRGDALLRAVSASEGGFVPVDEEEILPGRDELAHRGLYVEPTSAIVWSALSHTLEHLPDPVVVILTGSGLKYAG